MHYEQLPQDVQQLADKSYELLKHNPQHPSLHLKQIGRSLHLKQIGRFWSVRVGLRYRAVAVEGPMGLVWFWIGTHAEYDGLIRRSS